MVFHPAIATAASTATSVAFSSALVPLQFTGDFLSLAIVFFVLAVVAAIVGFRGLAGVSMEIARIAILVFVVLAVAALIL